MKRTMTAMQKAFVQEYLRNGQNAYRAWAVVKGRNPEKPGTVAEYQRAKELLHRKNVQAKLAEANKVVDKKIAESAAVMGITKERIIEELAKLAFSNATDVAGWDEKGQVTYKSSDDLTEDVKASIAEIQGGKSGLKIKHHDKKDALIQLGKALGFFIEKVNHEHKVQSVNFVIEME